MADETQTAPERETVDESGRIRNPMSPATWTADEKPPEVQPGGVQPELPATQEPPAKEPGPKGTPPKTPPKAA